MRDLRISVTDKCNLRCTYCMPADRYGENYVFLKRDQLLSFEEVTRVARVAAGLGVQKLRVTGGEPLLRKDLPSLIAMLAAIPGVEIALTTNGILLPQLAQPLRAAGLHRVTVSLDAMDDAHFDRMSGGHGSVSAVLQGIGAAEAAGFTSIKINCVVQRGVNDDGVVGMAGHFRGTGHVLRFIEYMDVGTCNGWRMEQVAFSRDVLARIHAVYPLRPLESNYRGEVASRYAYEDGRGEIGFISSISEPFCGDCTRLRLSADGSLYTCLFATQGTDLRSHLRNGASDGELEHMLSAVWQRRADRYSELRSGAQGDGPDSRKIEMYHIGG
jgi:cyclic pyranopterin phosphate synthase